MGQQGESPATSVSGRKRLGELALEKGLISSTQLTDALKTQGELHKLGLSERIGTILFKKKVISQQALDLLLTEQTTLEADAKSTQSKKSRRLGNFELYEKVGAGAMGVVFRARQITMDRIVAVKILATKYASDESFIKRFVREARAAGQFSHENIVTALDVGFIEPYHYFVMEFVEGQTLRKRIQEKGTLPENEALGLAMQIAKGLDHALSKKILHRDVKPENVIVTPSGVAKLLDMGLACVAGASQDDLAEGDPKTRKAAGTPHYISPEAARGEELDTRADLYSLGCTLYHMLAGVTPYEGTEGRAIMARQVAEPFPDIKAKRPALSDHAAGILQKLTAKDREQRYANPGETIEDLDRVLRGLAPKYAVSPSGKSGRARSGSTTGPRVPIGERGTTGPRAPIRPRGTTTGPASPIMGDRTGNLNPTQPQLVSGGKNPQARGNSAVLIGVAAAVVILIGVGVAMLGGDHKTTAKTPPHETIPEKTLAPEPIKKQEIKAPVGPSREQLAREAIDAAAKLAKESPEAYARIFPALQRAVEQAQNTTVAKLAGEALEEAQARYAKAIDAVLQKAQTESTAAEAKKDWRAVSEAFRDDLLNEDLRAGDGLKRLSEARQAVAAKAETAAAKLLADARAKAQPANAAGLADAIALAQQAEAIPAEFAPSAKLAADERAAWTAALDRLKQAEAQERLARAEKARALAGAVRKEMQPLLQSNRFSAARDLLDAKAREKDYADAAEDLKHEKADLDAILELRKDAIEALRKNAGQKVTLTKGNAKLAGVVKDSPANGVNLKLADGPEFTLGPEQLDAGDVDAWAPPGAGEAAKENLRRRALLFMAAGDFARARDYFAKARDAGVAAAQGYLERLEIFELGEKEVAARKAWSALEDQFASKKWKEIKRALETYKEQFGATKWATEKQKDFLAMLQEATTRVLMGNLPAKGLKLWLRFDEGKGAAAANAVAQGEAALKGATWGQGKVGGALALNGDQQYAMTTADLKDQFASEDVSISLWFNASTGGVLITEQGAPDLNTNWHDSQIEVLPSGEVKARVWQLEGISLGTVKFNEWHHAVVVYDKASTTLSGYLDGVKAAGEVKGDRQVPWKNNAGLFYALGASDSTNLGSGTFFKGLIDEVRIYDRPLSADEVKALAIGTADPDK